MGILGVKVWICQGIVYGKRDLFEIAGASAQAPSGDRGAVSYTHLDVYKRQCEHRELHGQTQEPLYQSRASGGSR